MFAIPIKANMIPYTLPPYPISRDLYQITAANEVLTIRVHCANARINIGYVG